MEEKKQIKISLKQAILVIIGILIVVFGIIFYIYHRQVTPPSDVTATTGSTSTTTIYENTKKKIPSNSDVKYNVLSSYYYERGNAENLFVTSNAELKTYLSKCFNDSSSKTNYTSKAQERNQMYLLNEITVNEQPVLTYFDDNFFENNNLAIQMYDASSSHHSYSIASVTTKNSIATINIKDDAHTYGGAFALSTHINFIVLDKDINRVDFDIYRTTTNNSYETDFGTFFIAGIVISIVVIVIVLMIVVKHNKKVDNQTTDKGNFKKIVFGIIITILVIIAIFFAIISYEALMTPNMTVYKPIIYLYPTKEENVSVKLLYDDMITVSYPKYTTEWSVLAQRDGSLIDLSTNKNLYSLYYECENTVKFKVESDGFIVKGEDSATFLEEKLAVLGLTERETEEFIIYWLPKLEANKYNYIRFATLDEINANMPLEINPNPDTVIRILMTFKALDKPITIKEQQLITPERKGFVAVEWGGTEIK